jgi:hypothetical protein
VSARSDLIACFERHTSSAVAEIVADTILNKYREELVDLIREAVPPGITVGGPFTSGQMFAASVLTREGI